jgi:hypothetical protein
MQQSIFGEDLSLQGHITTKLSPYLPALWKSFQAPWEDVQRRRLDDPVFARMTGEDSAWWLHGRAIEVATELFATYHPEVRIQDKVFGTKRMFSLIVDDEIFIHLKKLRGRLLRSNYPTRHNGLYWHQRSLPGIKTYHVIFGYRLLRAETLLQMYLTYPTGRRHNAWAQLIEDQTEAAKKLDLAATPSQGREDERKVHVVPKPKRKPGRKDRRKEA